MLSGTGTFTVSADYQDGNSRSGINMDQAVTILGDRLGSLTVGASSVPPPVVGNLTVTPSMLNFAAQAGGPNPANQVLSIGSTQGQVEWEAIPSVPWLTATASGAFTPASLTVGANTAGMPAGTYTASILLNSIDSNEILLPVTLNVSGAGGSALTVTPASLAFSGTQGGMNPLPQGLSIGSTGAALSWSASDNAPWLSLTAASGTTPSGTMAAVNLAGLAAGSYSATITVSSPSAAPVNVPVTLSVAAPPAGGSLTVDPSVFNLSAPAGGPAPSVQVLNIGSTGAPLNWSVADDQPWLALGPTNGTTPGATNLTISVATLTAGSYSAVITVSAAGVPAVSVPVNLTITPVLPGAPEVNGFNPVSGPVGTSVEILGLNFANATAVSFNNVPAPPPVLLRNGNLQTTVPSGATTGLIRVTNPAGTGASFTPFTVTGMGPTITDINPKSGPRGTAVTIFGGNLSGASAAFGGSPASVVPAGDNFLLATVPMGAPSGSVAVTATKNGITATSPFNFSVTADTQAGLTATPSLTFNAQVGQPNPPAQAFVIDSSPAGAAYSWSVAEDAAWLSLSPTTGTTPGNTQAFVNIAGLLAGTYTATITVSSPTAANSPITRPVTLNVAPSTPSGQLAVTPASITATTAVGVEPPIRTLTITSTGSPLNWSVTSSVPWITFSASAGTTPGSTFASFNTAAFPAGTYSANIMISAPGASTLTVPVTITIGSGGGGGGTLSVRVMQPNGGEFFQTGQTVAIQWTSTGAVAHDIAYSLNGLTFTSLATSYTASSTTYMWRIPTNLVPSQEERPLWVRVIARASTGATAEDRSDAFATVFNPF